MIHRKTKKKEILRLGRECKRCGHCCKYGSGYVLKEDIARIAKRLRLSESEFVTNYLSQVEVFHTLVHKLKIIHNRNSYGKCILYDDKKGCTIHRVKPLHCKVSSCNKYGRAIQEWFALNYLVNVFDPQSLREWNTHTKLHRTIPGGQAVELLPDKQKMKKILQYKILM